MRVAGRVSLIGNVLALAHLVLVCGDADFLLDLERGFDNGGEKAREEMPVDVAVEGPDA